MATNPLALILVAVFVVALAVALLAAECLAWRSSRRQGAMLVGSSEDKSATTAEPNSLSAQG